MPDFAVHFFICNIFISIGIGSISMVKHLLKKHVSAQILYYLWFFVLGLMAVPFLPADIFLLLPKLSSDRLSQTGLMDMSAQRLFTDPGSIFTEAFRKRDLWICLPNVSSQIRDLYSQNPMTLQFLSAAGLHRFLCFC